MFAAVATTPVAFILCGIIWSIALGFAVGNYACSLVHRLPRGRLILDKTPYCGSCGTPLQVRDLFPVISALLLKHRCRYCGAPFPKSHTWTELLVGLLFILCYLEWGFSQQYLLIACLGVFLIVLAAIEANDGIIMGKVLVCVAIFGMLNRTLADGSIYGFFIGGFYALIIGAVLFYKHIKPMGHIYTLPKPVELLVIGGICVGAHALLVFLLLFAIFYGFFVFVKIPARLTGAFGLAAILPILYPQFSLPAVFH